LGAAQSLEKFSHNKILSEDVSHKAETSAESIQEEVNQPGDTPPVETS